MEIPIVASFRGIGQNTLLTLTALVIGLLAVELALRWFRPIAIATIQSNEVDVAGRNNEYLIPDSSLGLRPNLGTSVFDENGIGISNSIRSDAENARKILFIGDSVTQRAEIVRALAGKLSVENTSFLNGGVSGYNIREEVEFFLRFQHVVEPDMIFHTIHVNDLYSTKLINRNSDGSLSIHARNANPQNINKFLYRHSQLFRFLIMRFYLKVGQDELLTEAKKSMRQLKDYMQEKGIAYHATLFPILEPYQEWSSYDKKSRDQLLAMFGELGLNIVDLLEISEHMLEKGDDPQQSPGDSWHPNAAFGDRSATFLIDRVPSLASGGIGN